MARQTVTLQERAARRRAHAKAMLRDEFSTATPWARLALAYIGGLQSPQTCMTYASNLRHYLRWCVGQGLEPLAVRPSEARAYLASIEHLAPCTRANRCIAARGFYNAAIDDEILERNPFARVKPTSVEPKDETPALTEEQFAEVLEAIRAKLIRHPGRLVHERDYALVYLMGRLGPRRVSLVGAKWGDLAPGKPAGPEITFHLKRDRYSTLILPPDVLPLLERWRHLLARAIGRPLRDDDAVFPPIGPMARALPSRIGDAPLPAMTEASISYQVTGRLADVGIVGRRWSAHAMRATSITCAYEHGATLDALAEQAGHLNPSQTREYIRRRRRECPAATWTPVARPLPVVPDADVVVLDEPPANAA